MIVMGRIVLVLLIFFMSGCASEDQNNTPLLTIEEGNFEIVIQAKGELQATKSTAINVPMNIRGGLIIEWIIPENTYVEEGDIVLKFDGKQYLDQIEAEQRNLNTLALDIAEKKEELVFNKWQNTSELATVTAEYDLMSHYSPADERIFSRNEIEEARMDAVYLKKQRDNIEENLNRYAEKAAAELQLLELRKKTYTMKLNQMKETLELLEVRAPHAGLLVYKKNWWGEKPTVGNTVWGGIPLAELPDLKTMEVKAYVLESEAGGLQQDLECEINLDAIAWKSYTGRVKSVAKLAQPIKKDVPINYFEVIISLDSTDTTAMKPGSQVTARIFVEHQKSVIVIPNQCLFREDNESYIYVRNITGFEKRLVQTGKRSITQTVITSGLTVGEQVALKTPEGEES